MADSYAELRAALNQTCHALLIDDPDTIRALLAERDAFADVLEAIASIKATPGRAKADALLASVVNLASAALAQGQGEA
jgi:hypothetical protein